MVFQLDLEMPTTGRGGIVSKAFSPNVTTRDVTMQLGAQCSCDRGSSDF